MQDTITHIIKRIKQPKKGFIPVTMFKKSHLGEDNLIFFNKDSAKSGEIALTVEYLTKFMITKDALKSFAPAIRGATSVNELEIALNLVEDIVDTEEESIRSAFKLAYYTKFYDNPNASKYYVSYSESFTNDFFEEVVSKETIQNIQNMVSRSVDFISRYINKNNNNTDNNNNLIDVSFEFDTTFYYDVILNLDGCFLFKDCLVDIVASKKGLNNKDTLKMYLYYLIGAKLTKDIRFKYVKSIVLYNPRKNDVYILNLENVNLTTEYLVLRNIFFS